jgi:hypothetical protein
VPNVPLAHKSFWMHSMVLLRDVGQVEPHFGPFGKVLMLVKNRCIICAECTIGSETIFNAPGGTPRGRGSC